jgi:F0F1-type ATP synthase membrane subunit a
VRDEIAIPNIGHKKYAKFLPYLLTVFFFVWINNLIGLIPFFPFSSNLTGNIFFTFVLAFITFIITNVNGNRDYWAHIFAPPVPTPPTARCGCSTRIPPRPLGSRRAGCCSPARLWAQGTQQTV